LSTNNLMI